jgi:hypothetical protein
LIGVRRSHRSRRTAATDHREKAGASDSLARDIVGHDSELIEWTFPDKPNSRLQKYRLTDKGLALLDGAKKSDSKT